ncbi:Proteasome subunit alpha type-2 [Geodia barretti]|uniref:Proteasome subunit alpha type-2 n=1 Tax=Geodia barretti TaxID=519541 RepID=A0AA35R1V4_GEOBA|nr:Proteasome subunit alpha type-2 [Geodia barretti]
MTERYSFSLTTFSPSGKLVQIEYALQAVAAGAPAVGIKGKATQHLHSFQCNL